MKEDGKGKTFSGISRRQFLGAGAGVAGGVIVGDQLFPRELRAIGIPKSWNKEIEVVVVGSGYVGLAAAIEAHDITKPAKPPEQKKCLSCHADYKRATIQTDKTLPPPHDSHMGDLDCGLCHHQHSRSENFCSQCHDWKYLVP